MSFDVKKEQTAKPSRTVIEEWREEKPLMSDGREGQNSGGKTFT